MATPAASQPTWRKSTHSNGQGECVEVAATRRRISVRDSKAPEGPILSVTPDGWRVFLMSIKGGGPSPDR
ncbi:DUF397 domain-containing protein [Actinomadura viridis]|uniref:DUF397 domain-containing protein n=1 Tax=Actinomadura viridis TaxID=58110 RepID=UPI0036A92818